MNRKQDFDLLSLCLFSIIGISILGVIYSVLYIVVYLRTDLDPFPGIAAVSTSFLLLECSLAVNASIHVHKKKRAASMFVIHPRY